jgi:hypothetical protein
MNEQVVCHSKVNESRKSGRPPQFAEREEGNEGTKYDDTPADQIGDADFKKQTGKPGTE